MARQERKRATRRENPGRDQNAQDMSDQPQQAMESGEPSETGRSHGRVINGRGVPVGYARNDRNSTPSAPESGRHEATPD